MDDHARISPTAFYTGQAWHELGFAYASIFETRRGRSLFAGYRLLERLRGAGDGPSLLVRSLHNRHATIDRALAAMEPDRLVELGAGLSPRGIAFAVDRGIDVVDLDLPAMVALKRDLLRRRALPSVRARAEAHYRIAPVDVTSPDLAERLREELRGSERPAIVAEGLIGYFARDVQLRILEGVRAALESDRRVGGAFFADLRVEEGRADSASAFATLRLGQTILTRGRGASPGFATEDEACALFTRAGFARTEVLARLDEESPQVMSRVFRAEAMRR